jgi:hypothetical protein
VERRRNRYWRAGLRLFCSAIGALVGGALGVAQQSGFEVSGGCSMPGCVPPPATVIRPDLLVLAPYVLVGALVGLTLCLLAESLVERLGR